LSAPVAMSSLFHGVFVGCALAIGVAVAGPPVADASLEALLACRDTADSNARLACFDRESSKLNAVLATRASVASTTEPVASAQPLAPSEKFGLSEQAVAEREVAAGSRAPEAQMIDVHVSAVSQSSDGRFTFTLDNGQVWRQLLKEGDMLAKPGDAATVSRGMLGSYWLAFESRRGCKVTRIR